MKALGPFFAACLAFAPSLAADAPPPVPGMESVDDNGRSFLTQSQRLPLRIYDEPGLMDLPEDEQASILDRVVDAGFNTVSFEAPLVGPQGLSRDLGKIDPKARAAWIRVFEACERRRLYALPVLWTPATVDALIGKSTARDRFFGGRNALGWQAWGLRQAAALPVRGRPLSATASVAGWLLYRGPWPDGAPLPGRPAAVTPTAEARLRVWARWQVQAARRSGFRQRLGLGFWPKQDLGVLAALPDEAGPAGGAAPVAELSGPNTMAFDEDRALALDVLPQVPGAETELVTELDDSAVLKEPPPSPWDLEGLDWEAVENLFSSMPLASQVDFLEFTLDTEDWYRVGERLAEAAQATEVPVIWRQDWRTASRYERNKRLAPPPPLAGIAGGWPEEDFPSAGETLWPVHRAPSPETALFRIRGARLLRVGDRIALQLTLNRPAAVIVNHGKSLPLSGQAATRPTAKPKAEHELILQGVAPGSQFLLKVQALSPQHGAALMRTRWVRAPK